MSDAQFQKMFTYMQEEFAKVHRELEQKADGDRVEHVIDMLDAETKRHETDEQERSFLNHTVDNHETRITKLEEKAAL